MDYEVEKRLDAFISGKFREPAFIEELCAVCASTPDFTWDVLAITDQYYRRGKISADLSRTIRHAIERPALAREVAGFAATTPMAQVAPIVPVAPAPVAQAALVAAPDELHALRDGLHASRQKLLRYRTRLTKLAAFAHKHRHALAEARREFESSRVHALAAFVPGPHMRWILRRQTAARCRASAPIVIALLARQGGCGNRNSWRQSPCS